MLNLVNLCHLDISGACSIWKLPSGIGILTNLQVLSNFIVGQGDAANIREMHDLSGLKGMLSISGLQNVNEAQDACEAKLFEKAGVSDLKLKWSDNFDENLRKKEVERDVLSFLKPHKEIKSLTISFYAGESFPNWIAGPSFEKLQSLTLEGCWNCKTLPAVGKLPLLKDLCIKGMDGVTRVGNEFCGENLANAFPSLESLCFEGMPEWKEWESCEVDEQSKIFHGLRELHIRNCPKLAERFSVNGFRYLEELQIHNCLELEVSISTLPKLGALGIDGCKEVVFGSYSDVCSVKEVVLSNISKLACESKETLMSESIKVESLNVNGCWWETKWGWLAPLESLCDLNIIECPQVLSVGATKIREEEKEGHMQLNVPCNIRRMRIEDCEGFEKISKSFQNLRCLGRLEITNCGKLVSVETNSLPPTLKHLTIRRCENVQYCLLDDREDMNFSNTSLLQSLYVSECRALKSLSSSGKLPLCLKSLRISDCENVQCLLEDREDVNFSTKSLLQSLDVWECKALKSLSSSGKLPLRLKSLDISDCENVQCLLEDREDMNFSTTSLLQSLSIRGCEALKSLSSSGKLPLYLKSLDISGCSELEFVGQEIRDEACLESISIDECEKMKYLPQGLDKLSSLHDIWIYGCPELECLPESASGLPTYTNLNSMTLYDCEKLQAVPQLKSLDHLQELDIRQCPRLKSIFCPGTFGLPTNLTQLQLEVDGPDAIKALMEGGLRRLASLRTLTIYGSNSFAEEKDKIEMKLPTSLTCLALWNFKNLRKISSNTFQNLTSLQTLEIDNCPKLKSLPKKEMLPSLARLIIRNCPELKKRCQRDKGKLWSNIAHIPLAKIDGENIYE